MNRILKFRVWDIQQKKWGNCLYVDIVSFKLRPVDISNTENFIIQQYTGLDDSRGRPIFEGDYIRGMFDIGSGVFLNKIREIKWSMDGYKWSYWDLGTIEVVGNVFETDYATLK